MILTFLILFVLISVWDVGHAGRSLDHMVNPRRKGTDSQVMPR